MPPTSDSCGTDGLKTRDHGVAVPAVDVGRADFGSLRVPQPVCRRASHITPKITAPVTHQASARRSCRYGGRSLWRSRRTNTESVGRPRRTVVALRAGLTCEAAPAVGWVGRAWCSSVWNCSPRSSSTGSSRLSSASVRVSSAAARSIALAVFRLRSGGPRRVPTSKPSPPGPLCGRCFFSFPIRRERFQERPWLGWFAGWRRQEFVEPPGEIVQAACELAESLFGE